MKGIPWTKSPNHRAPNEQLTISWLFHCISMCTQKIHKDIHSPQKKTDGKTCWREKGDLDKRHPLLGSGFKRFFIFIPIWGNDPILTNIFQLGWNQQPVGHFIKESFESPMLCYHGEAFGRGQSWDFDMCGFLRWELRMMGLNSIPKIVFLNHGRPWYKYDRSIYGFLRLLYLFIKHVLRYLFDKD